MTVLEESGERHVKAHRGRTAPWTWRPQPAALERAWPRDTWISDFSLESWESTQRVVICRAAPGYWDEVSFSGCHLPMCRVEGTGHMQSRPFWA